MMEMVKRLWKEEEGQGLVEYALIISLIAIACIFAVNALGEKMQGTFNKIKNELSS